MYNDPILDQLDENAILYLRDIKRKKDIARKEIAMLERQILETEVKIDEEKHRLGIVETAPDRDQIIANARRRFRLNAKQSIEYLVETGFFAMKGTPEEVARFMYETEDLSKASIGDYLGEHHEANVATLRAFACMHDFASVDFDEALRKYLWSFRLPGESQKIDRMMEAFASRYCQCHPGMFTHPDVCYLLAFSCIMLNTSLHNPNVIFKPSLEQFIEMNRDPDAEHQQTLTDEQFGRIYESIAKTPFRLADDETGGMAFFNPERQGWLDKEGGAAKSWKRRWVVLTNSCLYYFKSNTDAKPCGIIPLENVVVRLAKVESSGLFSLRRTSKSVQAFFEILPDEKSGLKEIKGCKTNAKGEIVQGNHARYLFASSSEAEANEWVQCINSSVKDGSAVYNLFRKKRAGIK